MARPRKYVVRLTDEEVERIQKKAKDTLNNSPEIRIKRMENGISIKNQTKASKQEGNHGLFPLKRA